MSYKHVKAVTQNDRRMKKTLAIGLEFYGQPRCPLLITKVGLGYSP